MTLNAFDRSLALKPAPLPPSLRASLTTILGSIRIIGMSQFQIGTRDIVTLPPMTAAEQARTVTSRLSESLWPALYDAAYARPFSPHAPAPLAVPADLDLLAQLRAAFPEGARWSAQWQVYKVEANGSVHVRKGDCCRHVFPGAFASASHGPVQANADVSILLPMASSQMQSAFYHITGNAPHCDHDDAALARLYLNTRATSVVTVMAAMARLLNTYAVPFRAKTLLDPAAYGRTDSTVFYLARRHLPFALSLARDIFTQAAGGLEPDVPLFSKRIADGVGGADDPGYGMSFGQTRTMLLADAIVSAWAIGDQTVQTRLDHLERRFAEESISPNAPHLSAGNSDIYVIPA